VITQTLADTIDVAREAVGADGFKVLTIGFDSRNDTPDRMRTFARQQGVGDRNWLLLSADTTTIAALARDLGFLFVKTPYGFDHLAQTTVINGAGTVVAQIYGQDFAAPQLVEPLKQAVFGVGIDTVSVSGIVNRVKLFCTLYDPNSGRYKFDYSLFIGMVIGFVSVAIIGFVVVRAWWRLRATA
jgi:protein SCO1/2